MARAKVLDTLRRTWAAKEWGMPDWLQAFAELVGDDHSILPEDLEPGAWPVQRLMEEEEMPVGSITAFGGAAAPEGWLECDGRELVEGEHEELRTVLGSTWAYSGDPEGTVRLPDLRGRAWIGSGVEPIGTLLGAREVTLTGQQMPSHNHGNGLAQDATVHGSHNHDFSFDRITVSLGADASAISQIRNGVAGDHLRSSAAASISESHNHDLNATDFIGGDGPHENMQPSTAGLWIIRAA